MTHREQRSIARQNRILASELGSKPLHAWKYSEDLVWPMQELDDAGQPVYDYRCACGVNVSVHAASCLLTVPTPRYIQRKVSLRLSNQWCVATLQTDGDLAAWIPLGYNRHYTPEYVCLDPGVLPCEEITWEVVRLIRDARSQTWADIENAYDEKHGPASGAPGKERLKYRADVKDAIKEELGLTTEPGKCRETSFRVTAVR